MKKFRNVETLSTLLVGVVIGGAIGASLGILFAPDKGSVTRNKHAAVRKRVVGFVKQKFNGIMKHVAE